MAAKVEIRDSKVQANLQGNVDHVISVTGILKSGDVINRLDGDTLAKDIQFQKEKQHRRYLIKEPHYKFTIEGAKIITKGTAAEAYIAQQIYGDNAILTVETKTEKQDFALGYKTETGSTKLIKRDSILGKKFAYGIGVTINYKIYSIRDTGEANIGFENIVFDTKPEFWVGASSGSVGAFSDWDTDADDLADANTVTADPEDESIVAASESADEAEDDWASQWS